MVRWVEFHRPGDGTGAIKRVTTPDRDPYRLSSAPECTVTAPVQWAGRHIPVPQLAYLRPRRTSPPRAWPNLASGAR